MTEKKRITGPFESAVGRPKPLTIKQRAAKRAERANKEAARIDREQSAYRAEAQKARAKKLAAQSKKKKPRKPWYKKYNPFAVLTEAQKPRKK